jgi:two-component system, OmpR family, sensor kinase
MLRLPLRTKLTAISALVTAFVLGVTGVLLYSNFRTSLERDLDGSLREHAERLAAGIIDEMPDSLLGSDELFLQFFDPAGQLRATSTPLTGLLLNQSSLQQLGGSTYYNGIVETTFGDVSARLFALRTERGVAVVGASKRAVTRPLHRFGLVLWVGGLVTLALVAGISWVLAGAALRPVEQMRSEAAAITAERSGNRLTVPDTDDEIARLGGTLNEMLDRLERAFERERRFVDDASHELRTPLSVLRTELELALRKARTKDELEAALRSAAEESMRLSRLAEELLVLARADRGMLPVQREDLELAPLVDDVADGFKVVLDQRSARLTTNVPDDLIVRADDLRLRQALTNLLDNAARFVDDGGTVTVGASRSDSEVVITVADDGPGFPDGFLRHAFEPFSRPDEGRSRAGGGAGLGLAIVRAVALAHGGSATASNSPAGGAVVTLALPLDSVGRDPTA